VPRRSSWDDPSASKRLVRSRRQDEHHEIVRRVVDAGGGCRTASNVGSRLVSASCVNPARPGRSTSGSRANSCAAKPVRVLASRSSATPPSTARRTSWSFAASARAWRAEPSKGSRHSLSAGSRLQLSPVSG
jgi:hypothetical protein